MTKGEFLIWLMFNSRSSADTRFHGDMLLLEIITTPPLGYSIWERRCAPG